MIGECLSDSFVTIHYRAPIDQAHGQRFPEYFIKPHDHTLGSGRAHFANEITFCGRPDYASRTLVVTQGNR